MGGKTGTSTSQVSIPPEVLQRYSAVNKLAEQTAQTPFKPYTGEFVAPLTGTQQAGIAATQAASQTAQPYYQAATGLGLAGAAPISPAPLQTGAYMNPYIQSVAAPTFQALRQQQAQEMAGQTANAIRSGAFGGDRAGIVAANLARQQTLGTAQAMAPIYQQGYQQALQTAQQQQGVQLGAEQANRAAIAAAAGQLAGLGTGAQQAGLQGAQAVLGAGTLEQQTKQAEDTAQYQQFLQERGYPFQVAQFLANIAMGTGALSGSTTTATQPIPFFSDRRLKDDVKQIGKTNDGMPIYSFKYKGDDATQIGLMAQDVERKHPEAVGVAGGYKTVDYAKATEDSARPEKGYGGGLVPSSMGGSVYESGAYGRGGYAIGGDVIDPNDIQALLAQQQQSFGPFAQSGLYGGSHQNAPYAAGVVPQQKLHTSKLVTSNMSLQPQQSIASQAMGAVDTALDARKKYQEVKDILARRKNDTPTSADATTQNSTSQKTQGVKPSSSSSSTTDTSAPKEEGLFDKIGKFTGFWADGGVVPHHYDLGGTAIDPYKIKSSDSGVPEDVLEKGERRALDVIKPTKPDPITRGPGNDIMDIAKLAMMFMRDGGRVGYDEGGPPKDDDRVSRILSSLAGIESGGQKDPYAALGPETKGDRAYGKYQIMGRNVGPWTREYLGQEMTPQDFLSNREAQENLMRARVGQQLAQGVAPDDIASIHFSGRPLTEARGRRDILGTTVPDYVNKFRQGLGRADMPDTQAVVAAENVPQARGPQPTVAEGLGKFLTENQGWLAPLGAGIKGMVQSKSPFLGAAILEGVGAGLEAYPGAQQTMATTGLTKAETARTEAETTTKSLHVIPGVGSYMWVKDRRTGALGLIPSMKYSRNMDQYEPAFGPRPTADQIAQANQQGFAVPGQGGGAPSATSTQPSTTEPRPTTAQQQAAVFNDQSRVAAQKSLQEVEDAQSTLTPGVANAPVEEGNNYRKGVVGMAQSTRANFPNTVEYIKNLTDAVELGGIQQSGTGAKIRGDMVKAFGTLASAFGVDPSINLGDVNDIAMKTQALRGQMAAQSAGQESFAALDMLANAMANPNMSDATMAKLGALMFALEARSMDRLEHADEWGKETGAIYYKAGKDFEDRRPMNKFEEEVDVLAQMIQKYPVEMRDMFKASPEEIDQAFKENFGLDNMSRYFRTR